MNNQRNIALSLLRNADVESVDGDPYGTAL
jgi:hypothetical protein